MTDQDGIEAVAQEVLRLAESDHVPVSAFEAYDWAACYIDAAPRLAAEVVRLREMLREYCVCGLEITALEADRAS
jgi:hypothetical protein